jgi:hypothetical protein
MLQQHIYSKYYIYYSINNATGIAPRALPSVYSSVIVWLALRNKHRSERMVEFITAQRILVHALQARVTPQSTEFIQYTGTVRCVVGMRGTIIFE